MTDDQVSEGETASDEAAVGSAANNSVDNDGATPAFTVLAGNPTPVELAAVTAVVTSMIDEASSRREPSTEGPTDAWARSQRRLRREIVPGPGAWNSDKF